MIANKWKRRNKWYSVWTGRDKKRGAHSVNGG